MVCFRDRESFVQLIEKLADGKVDTVFNSEDSNSQETNGTTFLDTGQNGSEPPDKEEKVTPVDTQKSCTEGEVKGGSEIAAEAAKQEAPKVPQEESAQAPAEETLKSVEEPPLKKQKTEEVSDAVEEPVLVVREEGSGNDCQTGNCFRQDSDSVIVGEAIEEEVMFFVGEGSGQDCDTGNPKADEDKPASAEGSVSNHTNANDAHPEGGGVADNCAQPEGKAGGKESLKADVSNDKSAVIGSSVSVSKALPSKGDDPLNLDMLQCGFFFGPGSLQSNKLIPTAHEEKAKVRQDFKVLDLGNEEPVKSNFLQSMGEMVDKLEKPKDEAVFRAPPPPPLSKDFRNKNSVRLSEDLSQDHELVSADQEKRGESKTDSPVTQEDSVSANSADKPEESASQNADHNSRIEPESSDLSSVSDESKISKESCDREISPEVENVQDNKLDESEKPNEVCEFEATPTEYSAVSKDTKETSEKSALPGDAETVEKMEPETESRESSATVSSHAKTEEEQVESTEAENSSSANKPNELPGTEVSSCAEEARDQNEISSEKVESESGESTLLRSKSEDERTGVEIAEPKNQVSSSDESQLNEVKSNIAVEPASTVSDEKLPEKTISQSTEKESLENASDSEPLTSSEQVSTPGSEVLSRTAESLNACEPPAPVKEEDITKVEDAGNEVSKEKSKPALMKHGIVEDVTEVPEKKAKTIEEEQLAAGSDQVKETDDSRDEVVKEEVDSEKGALSVKEEKVENDTEELPKSLDEESVKEEFEKDEKSAVKEETNRTEGVAEKEEAAGKRERAESKDSEGTEEKKKGKKERKEVVARVTRNTRSARKEADEEHKESERPGFTLANFSMEYVEPAPPSNRGRKRKKDEPVVEGESSQEVTRDEEESTDVGGKKPKLRGKRAADKQMRLQVEEQHQGEPSSSDDAEAAEPEVAKEVAPSRPGRGRPRGRGRRSFRGRRPAQHAPAAPVEKGSGEADESTPKAEAPKAKADGESPKPKAKRKSKC